MCEAPSTWRARICRIEPRSFSAEYSGLIAAPGTPNAQTTPSFSRIRTAASIARIFAMAQPFVGVAVSDDRAGEVRSQPDGFYFPRYGMPRKIPRLLRRLAGIKNGIGGRVHARALCLRILRQARRDA